MAKKKNSVKDRENPMGIYLATLFLVINGLWILFFAFYYLATAKLYVSFFTSARIVLTYIEIFVGALMLLFSIGIFFRKRWAYIMTLFFVSLMILRDLLVLTSTISIRFIIGLMLMVMVFALLVVNREQFKKVRS